jgi:multidrug efflux system membrane fusion protein
MAASDAGTAGRTTRRVLLAILGIATIGVVAWQVRVRTTEASGPPAKGGGRGDDARSIPVVSTTVRAVDVPVFVDGLGTVAAFQSVTIKPQVEGRLEKVLFTEGQAVHRGDALALIDARPFAVTAQQTSAAIARDSALLAAARATLERSTALQKEGLATTQQVEDQRAQVAQLEAVVRSDEATAAGARLQLEYTRITSPIDGVTGVRLVDAGNIVRPTDATGLVVVAQLDPISVFFTLPQDRLSDVAASLAKGKVAVDALDRDGTTKIASGEVALIDNQINQATATIRLKAVFRNPDHKLWPNAFVKARLLLTTLRAALVVPAPAIQRGPKGAFVYAINGQGDARTATPRDVEVDRLVMTPEGEIAVVRSGLTAGDEVVVDGQAQLRPGAKVTSVQPGGKEGNDKGKGDGKGGGRGKPASSGAPATSAPNAQPNAPPSASPSAGVTP